MRYPRDIWPRLLPTILLLAGSPGLLWTQDVSLAITLRIVDETPPTVAISAVDPDPRSTLPAPIRITFSEPVLRFDRNDLRLSRDGTPIDLSGTSLIQRSDRAWDLDLGARASSDGFYELTLPSGSDITDRVQWPLVNSASTSWTMTTIPPVLSQAVTRDSDHDGFLDRIELQLSKAIDDSTLEASDFTVPGWSVHAVTTGSLGQDDALVLLLNEADTPDTDARPRIDFTADGTQDLADHAGLKLANSSIIASDGAGPALIAAQTSDLEHVSVRFSEAIDDAHLIAADLLIADFPHSGSNGPALNWDTATQADDALIRLTLAQPIDEDDTGTLALDRLAAVIDRTGIASLQRSPIPITDGIAPGPAVIAADTADDDGDGFLDHLYLRFAAPVRIDPGALDDLTVGTYTLANRDGSSPSTTRLAIELVEGNLPDTGLRPRINWPLAGAVRDASTGARTPPVDDLLATDGAAPVLLGAWGRLDETLITLVFSEPIASASGAFAVSDFTYGDDSGGGNAALTSLAETNGTDADLVVATASALAFDDFGSDRIHVVAGRLIDAQGNSAVGREQVLSEQDAVPGLDPIADLVLLEDSSLRLLTLHDLRPSSQGTQISVQSTSSDSGLVPAPTLRNYDPLTRTATLPIAPVPQATGTASLRLRVSDETGAWIERRFQVLVTPVNDPPRLAPLADISMAEDSPGIAIPLSGLAPGPADEAGQSLSLRARSLDSARIANLAITYSPGSSTATLQLTPAADAFGPAMIVVDVSDDGGGDDTISRSFMVDITPVDDAPRLVRNLGLVLQIGDRRPIGANRLQSWDDGLAGAPDYRLVAVPADGELLLDETVLTTSARFDQAAIDAGRLSYRHLGTLPVVDGFTVALSDATGQSGGDHRFTIEVVDAGNTDNTAPLVELASEALTWSEGDAPVFLDPQLSLSDAENDLGGGLAVIEIISGAQSGDILAIASGAGVSQDGDHLLLDGVATADLITSSAPPRLQLLLGSQTTPASAQRLLRALTFSHSSDTPLDQTRRVQILVDDGDGGTSSPVTRDIVVSNIDSPPVLTFPSGSARYREGAPPVLLDAAAELSDPDSSDLADGSLRLHWLAGADSDDQLGIDSAGGPAGRVGLIDDTVTVDAAPVATRSGGTGGSDLVFTLGSQARIATVQALLRACVYANLADEPSSGLRQLQVTIDDGHGGTASAELGILIELLNDAPLLTLPTADLAYDENDPPLAVASPASVQDPDSTDFDGGLLRVVLNGAGPGDLLQLVDHAPITMADDGRVAYAGLAIGTASNDATGLTVAFLGSANSASVAATLAALRFSNHSAAPQIGTRQLAISLSDGDGGISGISSRSLTVSDRNRAPGITLAESAITFLEDAGTIAVFPEAQISDEDSADFADGILTIAITAGNLSQDRLVLSAPGLSFDGNRVLLDGLLIAEGANISGREGLLRLDLTSAANPNSATRLLQAVRFGNDSDTPLSTARRIEASISDGDGDRSPLVSVALTVRASNDAPQTSSLSIYAVPGIRINGQLPGRDPDGDALHWESLDEPSQGSFSLAANGHFHYQADASASGSDRVRFQVSDGSRSANGELHIAITALSEQRPYVISNPPPDARLDVAWNYVLLVDTSQLGTGARTMTFQLVGDVPPSLQLTAIGPTEAELNWLPGTDSRAIDVHHRFGVLFTDAQSGASGIVPIIVLVQGTPSANR